MEKYNIGMTTFNRPEYLKITLETFFNSDLSLAKSLTIIDDNSEEQTRKIISECAKNSPIPVDLNKNPRNVGADTNNIVMALKLFKFGDNYVNVDSDSKFGKNWLNEFHNMKVFCEENNIDWGFLTVFNTDKHHIIDNINEKYVHKKDIGAFASMFRKDIYFNMLKNKEILDRPTSFDWKYCWQCDLENKLIISTKNTYIQHIGYNGTNSNETSVDIGDNFIDG